MTKPSFVITVSVKGASSSSIWDAEKPLQIGHPFRWVAEKTESGVRIRNVASDKDNVVRDLTDAAIAKGASVELPEAGKSNSSPFTLDIRPVVSLPPVLSTHEGDPGELRVYAFRGDWTVEGECLSNSYEGYVQGQRAFRITKSAQGQYLLKSSHSELRYGAASVGAGELIKLSQDELVANELSVGEFKWRFDTLKEQPENPIPAAILSDLGEEDLTFRKSLKVAGGMLAAFLVIAMLWPRPEVQTPVTQNFEKIVFKKTVHMYATAAAMGYKTDSSFGETKSSHPRGSSRKKMASHQVRHTAPGHSTQHETKVAKHQAPAHKSAPQKMVAQAAPARPNHKSHSSHQTAKAPAVVRVARERPVAPVHAERNTQLAKLLTDKGLMSATHGLVKNGLTSSAARSQYASGQDSHAEANGMLSSKGGSHGGSFASSDTIDGRHVEVASLGGDSGVFGGNGGVGYGKGSHAQVSGQGKSIVSMDTGSSDVDEGLTKEQVGKVIHAHMSEIRYCYESAQLREPDLAGKLSVAFVVGAPGSVNTARVSQSSMGERELGECLVGRLKTWQFPHPRGGVNVAVNYPFIFKTLGR